MSPGKGTVEFSAKGVDIRVVLTSEMKKTRGSRNEVYSVGILSGEERVTWIRKTNTPGSKSIVEFPGFHDGCDQPGYIRFVIKYDSRTGITLTNCNNKKELQLKDRSPLADLKYVTISCWKSPVSFVDLCVW